MTSAPLTARRPTVRYAGMMQYDGDINLPERFSSLHRYTMGEYLANNGISQFACNPEVRSRHYFWNETAAAISTRQTSSTKRFKAMCRSKNAR